MFVGRTKELRELESLYAKASFDLVFVYGRRRVGNTQINEFTKGNNTVSYTVAEVVSSENLRLLSRSMLGNDISFPSYDALFAEIVLKPTCFVSSQIRRMTSSRRSKNSCAGQCYSQICAVIGGKYQFKSLICCFVAIQCRYSFLNKEKRGTRGTVSPDKQHEGRIKITRIQWL